MYSVYLLRSIKNSQMTYVGFTTKDIRERMDEHNRGLTRTTAPYIPWQIEVVVSFPLSINSFGLHGRRRLISGGQPPPAPAAPPPFRKNCQRT
ncbi:GIY-YIG nuclease family protein [Candidatus Peregrinibacteria bacterium]|nr:GIY-YIG nuclease family protein [Candidatus Peregrinibacteria bacterium]